MQALCRGNTRGLSSGLKATSYSPSHKRFSSRQPPPSCFEPRRSPPPLEAHCSAPELSPHEFFTICNILKDPAVCCGPALYSALDHTGVEPSPALLQALSHRFDSSPKLLHGLFTWAEKKHGFRSTAALFDSMINVLGKAKEFDSAWLSVLARIDADEGLLVSRHTFAILIRRYARAGLIQPAVRTFNFACEFGPLRHSDSENWLFEILLDALCKEGHVKAASDYLGKKKSEHGWVPSIRVYNILLNGWFRARKLKKAEKLWLEMRRENVTPTVVTYGTLVEGYCRMRRVDRAIEIVNEMRQEGVEPNVIIFNPIIDGLAEAGRFQEALGMMERLLVCESGPTLSTYNSLVKGFCKAGDLVGASRILKMMMSQGVIPTTTTYNYLFRHFSKYGKVEEAMNLYSKMMAEGYNPDRSTYHLILKMLCKDERLELAVQVRREMGARGFDMDLAASTMLIHLYCRVYRFQEALLEIEDMIRRGIVPQYLTFHRMNNELRKQGLTEMAQRLCDMMARVPHSKNLPSTYGKDARESKARRKSILRRAEAMSDMLKSSKDTRELVKHRTPAEKALWSASRLIQDINRRVKGATGA